MMTIEHPEHLHSAHEEGTTVLDFHKLNLDENIVIRSSEIAVLVILPVMLGRLKKSGRLSSPIIMDCGSGNDLRYIDVCDIATNLERMQVRLATAVLDLHAFNRCNFTAAFYRK